VPVGAEPAGDREALLADEHRVGALALRVHAQLGGPAAQRTSFGGLLAGSIASLSSRLASASGD
jgi:hypothetical protein